MNATQATAASVSHPEARRLDSLIIALAAGAVLGLILLARGNTNKQGITWPMHSPNDRSRWATVYSLGERGTYQIDETPWPPSIDRVQLADHFYSSKPPLLPTILAGEYLLLKKLSWDRLNFHDNPEAVIRTIVATVNLGPFVIFLVLYSRLLDRLAPTGWVRLYSMAAAAGGTYLTGFSVTLNNHTLAAFSSFFALYPALAIWCDGRRDWWRFALAGFFAAFTAVNELPAVVFALAMCAALAWKARFQTLRFFLPFALVPLAAHFYTNYLVTGGLLPAYANKEAYVFDGSYWKIDPDTGRLVGTKTDPATGEQVIDREGIDTQYEPWWRYLFHMLVGHHGIFSLSPIFLFSVLGLVRVLGAYRGLGSALGGPPSPPLSEERLGGAEGVSAPLETGSNVSTDPADKLASSRLRGEGPGGKGGNGLLAVAYGSNLLQPLALLAVPMTALLLVFYIFFAGNRNYGGMTNGLRWLFWLIPMWLVFLPEGLRWKASSRWFRGLALVFLVVSAASAFYATRNPWTRPWLHELLHYVEWIKY